MAFVDFFSTVSTYCDISDFFSTVNTDCDISDVDLVEEGNILENVQHVVNFSSFSEEDILKTCKKIKAKHPSGMDGIPCTY